ncbi:MAG: Helicase associated domain protein [Clostridia bacterium]
MIDLFKHNREAYEKAVSLFKKEKNLAIIHPTGTGKSFIGFKFCEDNPDKTICWLSPSEYIFKTQIENLEKSGVDSPKNIKFYTYSKLMLMNDEQLSKIKADYIILDEFHRCGAEIWGQGVERLLSIYKEAYLIGLSATHIRYLDNQRNMADELFDGNVASEMTLGEAIVRGILPAPKYVTALFSYKSQLKKYENKIKNKKQFFDRDGAEQLLEALRRTLEKAEGLDEVFEKHIENKTGKYIIFCANKEHLDTMVKKSKKWFSKIDKEPHVYTMYSYDSETDENLKDFKEDNSQHLKLLFSINQLNEGVHISGLDGVVLLRPTISPIIYKQQIGRALSASKKKSPVIFDIVNNFENLYSVGAIEKEMKDAVVYFNNNGESEDIVTEQFEIFEEVKECVSLFNQLSESLKTPWDEMYKIAKRFYETNNHLDVPAKFRTSEGYTLGLWIRNQRYAKRCNEITLTDARIKQLEEIGMCWENHIDVSWNKTYEMVKNQGVHNIKRNTIMNGINITEWISTQRQNRKQGILSQERIDKLNEINFSWDALEDNWLKNYSDLKDFVTINSRIPKTVENPQIRSWVSGQVKAKSKDKLDEYKEKLLTDLGVDFYNSHFDRMWNIRAEELQKYIAENGKFPEKKEAVGLWLYNELRRERNGRLLSYRKKKLEELGVIFGNRDDRAFAENILLLQKYLKEFKEYPDTRVQFENFNLGAWCTRIRRKYEKNQLKPEQYKKLCEINFDFRNSKEVKFEDEWEKNYNKLYGMVKINNRFPNYRENSNLMQWLKYQKSRTNITSVQQEKLSQLEQMVNL